MRCITFASERTNGERSFTYLWTELFDDFTIDIYRVKSMNSRTILEELFEVICRVEEGTWDSSNIKLVSAEAIKLTEVDRILKDTKFYSSMAHIIGALAVNNTAESEFTKVKILLSSIIEKMKNTYYDNLVEGLVREIEQENYENIQWYTNFWQQKLCKEAIHKFMSTILVKDYMEFSPSLQV
ncbi:hypothetical protein [Clostridium omnivorum]|uniref:Uncharacterized protein n=1 Tax=Clostridium omnivorum TaxID=1604902 RepID=A0ABQ5N7G0_9CLOT|nr:hypothetical protein [Clostridium sp. E14]GLC31169.1 hypothetical protein bsdE14_25790 [Clostridium sp. E14]